MNQRTINPLIIEDYQEIMKKLDSNTMKSFKEIVSKKTFTFVDEEFNHINECLEYNSMNEQHLYRFKKVVKFIEETILTYNQLF